jgi:hypothetical protein
LRAPKKHFSELLSSLTRFESRVQGLLSLACCAPPAGISVRFNGIHIEAFLPFSLNTPSKDVLSTCHQQPLLTTYTSAQLVFVVPTSCGCRCLINFLVIIFHTINTSGKEEGFYNRRYHVCRRSIQQTNQGRWWTYGRWTTTS